MKDFIFPLISLLLTLMILIYLATFSKERTNIMQLKCNKPGYVLIHDRDNYYCVTGEKL